MYYSITKGSRYVISMIKVISLKTGAGWRTLPIMLIESGFFFYLANICIFLQSLYSSHFLCPLAISCLIYIQKF